MKIPVSLRDHRGRRASRATIKAWRYRGEPRVAIHVGDITIRLDGRRAIRVADELVDAYENLGGEHD